MDRPAGRPPAGPAEPPERELASFERKTSRGLERLRLTLSTWHSQPYLALRVWRRMADGGWHPTKVGAPIRLSEAPDLIKAMQGVLDELGPKARRPSISERRASAKSPARRRGARPEPREGPVPELPPAERGFDEFGEAGGN
jgi:hypothetical protein